MKHFLILIVSLSFSIAAMAQDSLGFTNKAEAENRMVNGLREGKWVEYIKYDSVTTDSNWYALSIYKGGHIIGISQVYYDGEYGKYKAFETPYANGRENGKGKEYYSSGKLKQEVPYINGKKNGIAKGYWESGSLAAEYPYIDDKRNGIVKGYYENGILVGETPFTDDKENGLEKRYREDGKLESLTVWTEGVKGVTKYYDENGNEIK
ncbi:MAG TPA: hypothetical protein VK809_00960 [Bacteroidia bacterium]|jgi:antitoxin component YwqK of YwqJK toxin-antitoxin module|nr:hypothetical protein [Bacteroidia bacterium]